MEKAVANATFVANATSCPAEFSRHCASFAVARGLLSPWFNRSLGQSQPTRTEEPEEAVMIELTDSAVNAIRTAIAGASGPVEGLRIMVESGGCAGNKYMMGLVSQRDPSDFVVEKDGIAVFVDEKSLPLLQGATVDFAIGMDGSGFTFVNPNASSSCSCGKSFG
jgi:iron-sulfur cluster assembly protein